jgi:hypothetical protein
LDQCNEHFEDIQVLRVAQWELNQQMSWRELLRLLDAAAADKKYS